MNRLARNTDRIQEVIPPYCYRVCILIVLIVSPFSQVCAQNSVNAFAYFDENWREVQSMSEAYYYRTVDEADKMYLVRDYFAQSRALQMEAVCTGVIPELIRQGKVTWYYENGQVKRESQYKDNVPFGVSRTYYETGSPQSVDMIRDKKHLICQYWSAEGQELLVNGTGLIVRDQNELSTSFTEVADSLTVASYSVSGDTRDTVYTIVPSPAEYQGGFKKLYQNISSIIKYPKAARRNGIEGRVFIEFVIGKNGQMEGAKVVKGVGGGCDEEALRVLLLQNDWVPAMYKGSPVRQRMVLPITFKLG